MAHNTLRVSLTLPLGPSARQTPVTFEVMRDTHAEPTDYYPDLISGDLGDWENYDDAATACVDEAKRIWAECDAQQSSREEICDERDLSDVRAGAE